MAVIDGAGRKGLWVGLLGCVAACAAPGVFAATAPGFDVGSANVAVADPAVPRPPGKACVVELFKGFSFTDFSNRWSPSGSRRQS